MDGPYGQSTTLNLLCLLWPQLALFTSNPLIYSLKFCNSKTISLILFWLLGRLLELGLQQGLQSFFSGTKPPFARSDSGAFPENSSGAAVGKLGQGCRAGPYEYSQRCPCWKNRSTPAEVCAGFRQQLNSDSEGRPRVRARRAAAACLPARSPCNPAPRLCLCESHFL